MDQKESGPGALVSTEKVPPVSKRKSTDWPPTVINTQGSSGIIRIEACVETLRHLQSRLPWESDPWGLHFRGQSLLQYGPFQTRHRSWGWLRHLTAIPFEIPLLSTIVTSPSLFTGDLWAFLLRLFQSRFNNHVGASASCLVLFASYFPPYILYYNTPPKPVVSFSKDQFGPNACFQNLQQMSGEDWVRNLSFKIIPPCTFRINVSKPVESLP